MQLCSFRHLEVGTHPPRRYRRQKKKDSNLRGCINMVPNLRYLTSTKEYRRRARSVLLSDLLPASTSQKLRTDRTAPSLKTFRFTRLFALLSPVASPLSTMFSRPVYSSRLFISPLLFFPLVLFFSPSSLTKVDYFTNNESFALHTKGLSTFYDWVNCICKSITQLIDESNGRWASRRILMINHNANMYITKIYIHAYSIWILNNHLVYCTSQN